MNEAFIIPVIYQKTEQEFKARFERWGNTHRIAVLVGETTIVFEPDEEGSYRALDAVNTSSSQNRVSIDLLEAIAEKIAQLNG